jgi:hypothetical protein
LFFIYSTALNAVAAAISCIVDVTIIGQTKPPAPKKLAAPNKI